MNEKGETLVANYRRLADHSYRDVLHRTEGIAVADRPSLGGDAVDCCWTMPPEEGVFELELDKLAPLPPLAVDPQAYDYSPTSLQDHLANLASF